MKAIIYIRLSSFRGEGDPSTSPERQRQVCLSYAQAKGWEVVDVIEDLNVSGTDRGLRLDRPGLKLVRDRLPDVDVVLFAKLDRLARNVADFNAFAEEAAEHGAVLVSVAESLDMTSPSGRFVATILAAFAQMEGAVIAERTKAGHRAAAKLGRWTGGTAPYGYKAVGNPDGAGKVLALDPDEAAHVRLAVDHVLAGNTLYSTAKLLNDRGVKPRRAAKWSPSTVRGMLLGGSIRGHLTRGGGDVLRDAHGMPQIVHDAIVTPSEGLALDQLLARRTRAGERRARAARLLSGLLVCSSCGAPMSLHGEKGTTVYRCTTGFECELGVTIRAAKTEAYIEELYLNSLGWMPVTEERLVDAGTAERAAVEQAILETTSEMAESGADLSALVERLAALKARRDELVKNPVVATTVVETGETVAESWQERNLVGRQTLLRAAIREIVVYPASTQDGKRCFDVATRTEIHWR